MTNIDENHNKQSLVLDSESHEDESLYKKVNAIMRSNRIEQKIKNKDGKKIKIVRFTRKNITGDKLKNKRIAKLNLTNPRKPCLTRYIWSDNGEFNRAVRNCMNIDELRENEYYIAYQNALKSNNGVPVSGYRYFNKHKPKYKTCKVQLCLRVGLNAHGIYDEIKFLRFKVKKNGAWSFINNRIEISDIGRALSAAERKSISQSLFKAGIQIGAISEMFDISIRTAQTYVEDLRNKKYSRGINTNGNKR